MQHERSVRYDDATAARGEFTISHLARTYDVSLRTLRFYEDRGLLNPRRHGTARFYNASDRIRLETILKGKRLGFTLSEIQDLIGSRGDGDPSAAAESESGDLTTCLDHRQIITQIAHLERQRAELEAAIAELRQARARMEATVD